MKSNVGKFLEAKCQVISNDRLHDETNACTNSGRPLLTNCFGVLKLEMLSKNSGDLAVTVFQLFYINSLSL